MSSSLTLSDIRKEIDRIDAQLLQLLTERANCSLKVADIKKAETDGEVTFYRPEREAQIFRKVAEQNQGPLDDECVVRVFREIISSSLALEEPISVAYLGPEGTFTHAAAVKHFGSAVNFVPFAGIDDIFNATETGRTRFGIVPVENSTEGTINHTLDLLTESPLKIGGECRLRIEHNLLGKASGIDSIKAVYAHPQALAQCRHWLDQHLPNAERISQSSNAAAAEFVVNDATAAAVAGTSAASLYGLNILYRNIEDVRNNTTRFYVLGKMEVPPSGKDSTSLLVSVAHKPGSLRRMLEPFESADVSMTRIESRPSRTNLWEYNFFVDVDGHKDDAVLKRVLDEITAEAQLVRVLGSYPSAL